MHSNGAGSDKKFSVFQSVKKQSLLKDVEDQIKRSILEGVYKVSDKLPSERELVNQFQVGRSTVREALNNIESMGLICTKRGAEAGAYVSELTSRPITGIIENLIQAKAIDISHLIQARMYIEPSVAAHVAIKHTKEDIERIVAHLDNATNLLKKNTKEARLENILFHVEIAKSAHNPVITFLSESVVHASTAMLIEMTKTKISKAAVKKFIDAHRLILKEIINEDPVAAFQSAKQHLYDTYQDYLKVIPNYCDKNVSEQLKHFTEMIK
ncbi:MAG: FadR/GntR family transcriptional regulator [Syntrophales bacterium]